MRNGIVSLANDSSLNGIIWTHALLERHILTLNDSNQVKGLESIGILCGSLKWTEKGFSGYGRKTTRGIRGTGLDKFQRF